MTVRLMRPGDRAETGGGWVTVAVSVSETGPGGAELVVRPADGTAPEETGLVRAGLGTVMLTGIQTAVEVMVRTPDGVAFPHGTAVRLRIMVEFPDSGDRDEFAFEAVNVAGLVSAGLAGLAPAAGRLEVAAPTAPAAAEAVEPVLAGLAGTAQTIAREVVGHQARLPQARRRQFRVLVDRSASMLPHARSGAVADLLAVLQGLNAVAGTAAVDVLAAPGGAGWAPVGTGETAAAELAASIYARVETGFRVGDLLAGLERDAVYVLTDLAPPDLEVAGAGCRVLVVGDGAGPGAPGALIPVPARPFDRPGLTRLVRAALSWTT